MIKKINSAERKEKLVKMNKNRKFFIYFLFFLNIDVNLQNVFYTGFKRNKT